jgi:hypothetical protein
MEIKILNSILFKELMPWVFNTSNLKPINEKLKKIANKEATTEAELIQQLQILVADYPELTKWLTKQLPKATGTIKNHCFAIDFTEFSNAITKFYDKLISLETLRVYNAFNTKIQQYKNKIDIVYHTTIALKNVRALAINTVKEIKAKGFEAAPTDESQLAHFVLQLLRQHLIILFFDIQALRKSYLENEISIEDFYLLDLELPKSFLKELKQLQSNTSEEVKSIAQSNNKPFNFGFKGDEAKLKNLILVLCVHKNLLDQDITKQSDLFELFTTKNITDKHYKIQFGCNTNLVTYIVDSFKRTLPKLSYSNIERSGYFFTDNGTPIKGSLFSNSKSNNQLPKKAKEEIDKIFKENDM